MSIEAFVAEKRDRLGRGLTGMYARTMAWYLLGVGLLWVVGVEGSYGSPLPFYALVYPAFKSVLVPWTVVLILWLVYLAARDRFAPRPARGRYMSLGIWAVVAGLFAAVFAFQARMKGAEAIGMLADYWTQLRWHLLALLVFFVFFTGLLIATRRLNWFEQEPSRRTVVWFLVGLVAFAVMFSAAVAMIRNGPAGISQAYDRHGYEYVSDIGTTRSIGALFGDYVRVRPFLSMHAKVHPPGPIALLWLMSYAAGQDTLGLSIATIFLGALGVIPLYLWAADLAGRRTALTCGVIYSLMPSIVLFTATSADILFVPFTLTTLFLFWRALHRRSIAYALGAGIGFAAMSLLSFSLLSLGAYFAFVGLWRFCEARWRPHVIQTALVMGAAFLAVHLALRWSTGFDMIACYHGCRAQFLLDQQNLDLHAPRFASWIWKIANPACWFYFAGIPVSMLFVWRLKRPTADMKPLFAVFLLTLIALDFLYLARGEGERSAMYVLPFVALPAAHLLDELGRTARAIGPLAATAPFI